MESLMIASREMAAGNTFGATVLSSYGGFWISIAITFIPGGFNIVGALEEADKGSPVMFYNSFALYLMVCTYISGRLELPKANNPGMVHLYHHDNLLHRQIYRCILLPVCRGRPRHPPHRPIILLLERTANAKRRSHEGRRAPRFPFGFLGLV